MFTPTSYADLKYHFLRLIKPKILLLALRCYTTAIKIMPCYLNSSNYNIVETLRKLFIPVFCIRTIPMLLFCVAHKHKDLLEKSKFSFIKYAACTKFGIILAIFLPNKQFQMAAKLLNAYSQALNIKYMKITSSTSFELYGSFIVFKVLKQFVKKVFLPAESMELEWHRILDACFLGLFVQIARCNLINEFSLEVISAVTFGLIALSPFFCRQNGVSFLNQLFSRNTSTKVDISGKQSGIHSKVELKKDSTTTV